MESLFFGRNVLLDLQANSQEVGPPDLTMGRKELAISQHG